MSSNSINKLPITNDLRSKVLLKFQSIHAKLQTHVTAEALEKNCFDKSNNDQESYLRLCNSLVNHRNIQLQSKQQNDTVQRVNIPGNQVRTGLNPNLRPNMMNQNNGVSSDPINALQTLAVTAGQPSQMNMQQNNYRMGQQQIIQMTSSVPNFRIVGSIRSMDPYTIQQQQQQHLAQSPNPQMMSNQIQLQHMNSIRVIKKPDQSISQSPGFMDPNGSINNQMMPNTMHSNIVRPPVTRMVTSSSMPSILPQHQSPQEHYAIPTQIPQTITLVQSNSTTQPEDVPLQPNISSNTTPISQPATQAANTKQPISEEEALKVKEELAKLSAKYFNYIKLAIETPLDTPHDTIKIWLVLKGILDSSKPCDKPITLKHVAKIQIFSEKAEEHVLSHNLDFSRQPVVQSSEELFGKRIIPDRNKIAFSTEPVIDNLGLSNNSNSLDVAFDDMIHKINKQKTEHKRKVRDSLIKYIMHEKKEFMRLIPKYLQPDIDHMDTKENDTEIDENEFNFIDEIPVEGEHFQPIKKTNRAFDHNGLLKTDRDWSHSASDSVDVKRDIEFLSKEFEVNQIEPQIKTGAWVSVDSEWENSTFYSIRYKNKDLPSEVPSILVRIPEDYEQSSSADWNLNLLQYKNQSSAEAKIFLEDVIIALQDEFSSLSSQSWNVVPFLDIICIYKRSIQTGLSNYECRKSIIF